MTVTQYMTLKLANVLKRLLKERSLSLRDLAKATNIKPSTLSGWNNGVSPRDLTEVRRCAQYLGISMERLLFDEDSSIMSLESLLTENVFDGFLKVKIEKVIIKR